MKGRTKSRRASRALQVLQSSRVARSIAAATLLVGVAGLASGLLFMNLGAPSLKGDEAIHTLVAADAAASDSWLPLMYRGRPYLSKPPLKILTVAWIFDRWGVSELNARLVDAGAGVLTVLATFLFGARVWNLRVGALGALVLLGAEQYVLRHGVRDGVQDAALVLFITVCLFSYFEYAEGARKRRWLLGVASLAFMAAIWTKGAIALVLVVPPLVGYEIALGAGDRLAQGIRFRWRGLAGVGTCGLAGYLAWLVVAARWGGDRLPRVLVHNLVMRNLEGVDPSHVHGVAFYPESLAQDFGFWLLAVGVAVTVLGHHPGGTDRRAVLYCCLWSAFAVGLPSLSVSKLPQYIYPAYPALALLVGRGVEVFLRQLSRHPVTGIASAMLLTWALVVRLETMEDRISQDDRLSPVHRFVRAAAALPMGADLEIRDPGSLSAAERLYLVRLHPRGRGNLSGGACRFVVQSDPGKPQGADLEPHLMPLRVVPRGDQIYVLDLDRCLPLWV